MPNYRYTARDDRGVAVNGVLAAPSPEALADQLKRMGYLVTKTRQLSNGVATSGLWRIGGRVGHDDLVLFNVQLAKMVQVGIPLVTALDTLHEQTDHPALQRAIGAVAKSVEGGASLSEALGQHPAVFSELFINMVRAGEASGKLDDILRRLAVFAKHQAELRQQLATALTYPVVLLVVGLSASAFLVMGIIPKFMKIFLDANVPLPLPTLLLHGLSQALRAGWPWLLGLLVLGGLGAGRYGRTPSGRRMRDQLLLRLPVLGDLVRKAALARLAKSLETLLASGVPVLDALAITEQTCGNVVIGEVCRSAQASVRQGRAISDGLRASRGIPPMVIQLVTVGEGSGTLDHMLAEIADHYDELVRHGLKRLTALIEPVFLVLMGGLVAFIMASVLLPLFRMVNVIR